MMKISILFKFTEGAWGGGNQFLKALRNKFIDMGVYEENPDKADCFVFNSYPFGNQSFFKRTFQLKRAGKILIHRVDGPIFKIRGKDLEVDKIIYRFNNSFADGTIFQSGWSKNENFGLGMKKGKYECVITNAPDPKIFNRQGRVNFDETRKVRLISVSWSDNLSKGFDVYQYLDRELDFSRYQMTFIGNSPVTFKNIKWIKPLSSAELAVELKKHDIYVAASKNDPCSNSLIEALHCGLPSIVLGDGGHPEILKGGGVVFNDKYELPKIIRKIVRNYDSFQKNIDLSNMDVVGDKYYQFIKQVFDSRNNGDYCQKRRFSLYLNQILVLNYLYKFKREMVRKVKSIFGK